MWSLSCNMDVIFVYIMIWKRNALIRHLINLNDSVKPSLLRVFYIPHTNRVHPFDVGGNTGEDCGLLGSIATQTRNKAGNTMDIVSSINVAVQGATRVTLGAIR